jgi:hypothetical protein
MVEINPLLLRQPKSKDMRWLEKISWHMIGDEVLSVAIRLAIKNIPLPIVW